MNAALESKVAPRTAELEHRARQLQQLTRELAEAEDRERQRLAEILRDDLQQVLAAAGFHLCVLDGRLKNDAEAQGLAAAVKELLGGRLKIKSAEGKGSTFQIVVPYERFKCEV